MMTITINIAITSPASAFAGCTIPNKHVIMSHCKIVDDSIPSRGSIPNDGMIRKSSKKLQIIVIEKNENDCSKFA